MTHSVLAAKVLRGDEDPAAARALRLKVARAVRWDSLDVIGNEMFVAAVDRDETRAVRGESRQGHPSRLDRSRIFQARPLLGGVGRGDALDYVAEFERFLPEFRGDREFYNSEIVARVERSLAPYFTDHSFS